MSIFTDTGKFLTDGQVKDIAKSFDVPYASVKAVIETETNGQGFYTGTCIPVVRLEEQYFHKRTNGIYSKSNPDVSSAAPNSKYDKAGYAEFARFQRAYQLDSNAAIWATSWGLGQIMGFNYEAAGEISLLNFAKSMFESESKQLTAMFSFLQKMGLLDELRKQKWKEFAIVYNGKDYAKNKYDQKLAEFYKKYS